jgi:hypothetical protein
MMYALADEDKRLKGDQFVSLSDYLHEDERRKSPLRSRSSDEKHGTSFDISNLFVGDSIDFAIRDMANKRADGMQMGCRLSGAQMEMTYC